MKHSNIQIIVVPEGEQQQGIKNLFEQIMKENFPNLVKENFQEIQGAQRVPKKLDPRRNTPRQSPLSYPRLNIKRES